MGRQDHGRDSTKVKAGGAGEATGTDKEMLKCTQATLHQWQFTRGGNRHRRPQTVMKTESEKNPTKQTRREERAATVSLMRRGRARRPSDYCRGLRSSEMVREPWLWLSIASSIRSSGERVRLKEHVTVACDIMGRANVQEPKPAPKPPVSSITAGLLLCLWTWLLQTDPQLQEQPHLNESTVCRSRV